MLSYDLAYQPFFVTGDMVADGKGGKTLAGGYYDIHNQPIIDATVPGKERQYFSDSPDGTSLLTVPGAKVDGVKGNAVFAVVQFEYATWAQDGKTDMYGKLPSPIAVLTLDQDPKTGKLTLVKYHNVDTSKVHGLWITCGASLSPWGTHLSSEEYEPDAFNAANAQLQAFSQNLYGNAATANPYHYGHMPEVIVNTDGTASIKKHYCMGRISHELVQVMPDNRTALMGDDATNSGYFVFVADKEKDLSSGTLYAAKVGAGFSIDPATGSAAALSWIKLGSATSAEIEALANTLKPTDIMSVVKADPNDASYTKIVANGKTEWIKINPGMEKAAAFLETHRYAAYVGASMGFTKMEGTTVNAKDKIAYSALQNVQASMVAGHAANVPGNGISVPKQLVAGVVMALNLRGGQKDTSGTAINSEWMPVDTKPLLAGEDLLDADGKTLKGDALGNTANPNKIANPDNLKFSEKMRTLFIGEDSSQHVNNFLWAYNIDTKTALARDVDSRWRRIDGPARRGRDQRLDLHHEQLPACRRLGRHPQRGQGHAGSADQGQLQGQVRRGCRLPHRHANADEAGLIPLRACTWHALHTGRRGLCPAFLRCARRCGHSPAQQFCARGSRTESEIRPKRRHGKREKLSIQ